MDKPSCIERLKELNVYELFSYRPELKIIPRVLRRRSESKPSAPGYRLGRNG